MTDRPHTRMTVTLSPQEVLDRAEAILEHTRQIGGENVDANSVEVRITAAALLILSLDGAMVLDPMPFVAAKVGAVRAQRKVLERTGGDA